MILQPKILIPGMPQWRRGRVSGAGGGTSFTETAYTDDAANWNSPGIKTISGMAIGSAASDRIICAAINLRAAGNVDQNGLMTVTIGGISAAYALICCTGLATANFLSCVAWANVPTGTTADLVVDLYNIDGSWIQAALYRLTGFSTTVQDSGTANGATTLSDTLTSSNGSAVVCAAVGNPNGGNEGTWSGGVTEQYDVDVDSDYGGIATGTATGSTISPQIVFAASTSNFTAFAAAVFAPS